MTDLLVRDPARIIFITVASVSLFLSLLTIFLIYSMKRWNGYLQLILNLTIAQCMYDISVIMSVGKGLIVHRTFAFLRICFGLASTFWTNVISIIIVYVVIYMEIFNIIENFNLIFTVVYLPSFIIGLINAITWSYICYELYYWLRIISIVVNITLYTILARYIYIRDKGSPKTLTTKNDPIKTLAHRMKYYPVVQVLSRLAAAWYEAKYNSGDDFTYNSAESVQEKISMIIYALTLASAGIGFFIIFVIVTPGAWEHLIEIMKYLFNTMIGRTGTPDPDEEVIVRESYERKSTTNELWRPATESSGTSKPYSSSMFTGSTTETLNTVEEVDYNTYDEWKLTKEIKTIRIASIDSKVDSRL